MGHHSLVLLIFSVCISSLKAQQPGDACYSITKSGTCPNDGKLSNPGGSACTDNRQCSGNRLCCFSNTGFRCCADPEPQNSGTCPKTLINPGIACNLDSDCPINKKCCPESPCSYRCSDSAPPPPPTQIIAVG